MYTYLISKTFSTVDPKSVLIGDFSDLGYVYENKEEIGLRDLINRIDLEGIPAIGDHYDFEFLSIDEEINYRTGESTTYNLFVSVKTNTGSRPLNAREKKVIWNNIRYKRKN